MCFIIYYVFYSTCIPSIFVKWKNLFEIKRCMLVNVCSVDILISDIERILALNPQASSLLFILFYFIFIQTYFRYLIWENNNLKYFDRTVEGRK